MRQREDAGYGAVAEFTGTLPSRLHPAGGLDLVPQLAGPRADTPALGAPRPLLRAWRRGPRRLG